MKLIYKILIMALLVGLLTFPQYLNQLNFTVLAEHSPDDPYPTFARANLVRTDCSGGTPRVKLGWGGYPSVESWSAGGDGWSQEGYNLEYYLEVLTSNTYPNGTLIPEGTYMVIGNSGGHSYNLWNIAETVYCPIATINITPDRAMEWSVSGSPLLCPDITLCTSNYAGHTRSYSFDASTDPTHTITAYGASVRATQALSPMRKFVQKFFNSAAADSATCNSSPGSTCNVTLTTTYCTINVVGNWNGSSNIPTNASYSISGPSSVSGTNSSGTNSHTLIADSGSSSFTFISSAYTGTINGYSSDAYASSSVLPCAPGSSITFNIISQSKPILDVR